MRPLNIAFDAKRLFHNREGLGAYARTLVRDLKTYHPEHNYFLCTPRVGDNDYAREFAGGTEFQLLTAEAQLGPDWYWRSKGMVRDLEKYEIDLYWGLSNELPMGIAGAKCKSVVTIHDLLYETFPQQFSVADRLIYQQKFKSATKQADRIVVPSQSTGKDLTQYFPQCLDKQVVMAQAIHEAYRSCGSDSNRSESAYYLIVGTINERKNLELVVRAYMLMEEQARTRVIVVGQGGQYKEQMEQLIKKESLEAYFEFRSDVDNVALRTLYQNARALLFPSRYEGFGRPIVEALSLGTPIVCLNNSSLPEVVGKHGIIIGYDRPEAMRAAIEEMNGEALQSKLMKGVDVHLEQFEAQKLSEQAMRMVVDTVAK